MSTITTYLISFSTLFFLLFTGIVTADSNSNETGVFKNKARYNGLDMEVIDLHFHPSSGWDQLGPLGREFIMKELPQWIPGPLKTVSLKVASSLINAPYGLFGIKNECKSSGISFCGLFATYAPETWGVVDNDYLIGVLDDQRNNSNKLNSKIFFGLASLDINDWEKFSSERLAGLEKALNHPLVKGIKMAHIHNNIPLSLETYDGIYLLAEKYNAPVYHHVGSSPIRSLDDFESQVDKDHYLSSYDPNELETLIKSYPNVNFILGHMGFDFNKEGFDFTDDSIRLATDYPNAFLEISAMGRPIYDEDGMFLDFALKRIKEQGIINKTIYGSDGPVYPGATKAYLNSILNSMSRNGYSYLEAQQILFHNANRIFNIY